MNNNRKTILYLIPICILLLACVLKTPQRPLSDFAGYYFGGKEILKSSFMNAYDMERLNFLIAGQGYENVYVSYAPFPPFTALVFAPFTVFSVMVAKILFDILSCLFFLFTVFRALRYFSLPDYILLLIPVLFFTPLANNVFFGQSYLLLFCLLLEGYMAYKKEKLLLSSFLWAFAILFKLFPVVLFLYLLLRKKHKNVIWLGIACTVFLLLSISISGIEVWKFYISQIVPKLGAGELNHPFTFAFQSAFMLGKRIFIYDPLLNPQPLFQNAQLFSISMGLFKATIISFCVMLTIKKKEDDFLSFGVWMLASMLVSPNGSTYSLILLLLPLLALLGNKETAQQRQWIFWSSCLLLLVACNLSLNRMEGLPVFFQFPRLYLLLLFFALLLWTQKKVFHAGLFIGITCILILPSLLKAAPKQDNSSYLLQKEKDLFIYDYIFKDGQLIYYSWDGKKNEVDTKVPVSSFVQDKTAIINNQVYYEGKQMTNSPDWKKRVNLINGHTIIYLSDKDRGICFYTLRKIELDSLR